MRAARWSERTPERITMLLENNPYPKDTRVRAEAESLTRAGHKVTVVAPLEPGQQRRELVDGVEVIRVPFFDGAPRGAGGFVLEYLLAGARLHWAAACALLHGSTVLHIHNPPDIFFAAGALFRLAGRQVVFDHHDLFAETVLAKFGPGAMCRWAARCQNLTFAVANHVIATNESYAQVARDAGGKAPEEVTIVRNGPPAAWTRLPVSRRDGFLRDLRLFYLGSISSQDGVDALAPILARLSAPPDNIDVHLTIVGDGDGRPALERALLEHGVSDRVTFTGWVPRERVPELAQEADLCVDPAPPTDVNDRSTMIKIAEYMALGKPIVAYDLLETRNTAAGGALLAGRGDPDAFHAAIVRLANDPELRRRLSERGRRRASELTWEHSERALLNAYDTLRARRTTTRALVAQALSSPSPQ